MSIPVPSIPDQDVEELLKQVIEYDAVAVKTVGVGDKELVELVEKAKREVQISCTPEWNRVCKALAYLYKLYSRPTGNLTTEVLEAPGVLKALDELMQAYDKWLG